MAIAVLRLLSVVLKRYSSERGLPGPNPAAAALLKRSRGQESPKGCAAAVRAALTQPFEDGLLVEREQFQKLVSGEQSEDGFAQAHRATPLGRSSTPQDIADAVVYAAGARALTGTTLLVDGGQHLTPSTRDVMFLTQPRNDEPNNRSTESSIQKA